MKLLAKFGVAVLMQVLMAASAGAAAGTLTLRPVAQVAGDDVTLRDLMIDPGSAEFPGTIVICRAPNAGSVRVITLEEISAALKKNDARYLLRGADRISVMRIGRKVVAADLEPLIEAALKTSDTSARLQEVQLQAAIFVNDLTGLKLRKLRFDPALQKYRAWFVASAAPHAVTFEAMATVEHGAVPREISLGKTAQPSPATAILVRRGETAAMQLDGEGFSATLNVLCLEDGAVTRVIRVREPATKRTYRAQVIGSRQLRAVSREN